MNSKKTTGPISPKATKQDFPIVGIGASAGGLSAFKSFLKAIPEDSGMAYVIVQHLDPNHESILPEILSKVTKIPVNEISDEIHLAPNNIYVIPANKTLTAEDGILKLTPRDKLKTNRAIDVFFTSLAEVHQSLAVGVVLSGTASDGTIGLKAIKAHGGITFAQDQQSAQYGDMPQNAENADVVDFVLPPEEIPGMLLRIISTYKKVQNEDEKIIEKEEDQYRQIVSILSQHSGVDFNFYKQTTIRRRLARRMAISKNEKLADYLKFLRDDKVEQQALFSDMLIPVTTFFREPDIFKTLKEKVFPLIFKGKTIGEPIRIWAAGCSTGEEAYSIAISIKDCLGEKLSGKQIQIFGSDISEASIAKARMGIYSKFEFEKIPDAIIKNYFTKTREGYQVNKEIRDMCVFAVHNFLKDPPFAKMDMISCRNVLIYMDTFLQKKALTTFHYALRENGFLFLGKSETTGPAEELFIPFAKENRIYSRKSVPGRYVHVATKRKEDLLAENDKKAANEVQRADFRKTAEWILLTKHTPGSVVINEQMDILHIIGNISPFLEPAQGKPSFNLLKMARESLAFELRNTVHKVKSTGSTVIRENIPVNINGKKHSVAIEIIPLKNSAELYYLIIFHKTLLPAKKEKASVITDIENEDHRKAYERNKQFEKELAQTRDDMRSITEDQEATIEELQSANEELLSSSEEMQSLNEELETSKEEIQSTNEELIIVNQELHDKHEQLNTARIYAESIIATIREPLVILDKNLSVKEANTSFYKKFNLTEQEAEGMSIYEIKQNMFGNSLLRSLLEKVLPKRTEVNDYEIIINLPPFGDCTLLVNARQILNQKNTEQLILMSIEDITERKISQQRLKTSAEELELKVKERTALMRQSNVQLEQFAHTASHELQEPLRKITTFSKVIKQRYDEGNEEEVKKYLSKIEESSSRMTQLIQHLLAFAGVTHHKELFEKTNLNEIFKNIVNDFELGIAEKKALVTSDKLPEIEAIPFQMNQLFYDLISNAMKFSKPGVQPVIHISSHKLTKEEMKAFPDFNHKLDFYEIVFQDNGIGFDQKYEKQIFTMFQRLNTSGSYPGTGIGLALCKKIVQNYHGEIWAKGKEGEGAAFHVILPVKQPKPEISKG